MKHFSKANRVVERTQTVTVETSGKAMTPYNLTRRELMACPQCDMTEVYSTPAIRIMNEHNGIGYFYCAACGYHFERPVCR